jgi:hypothetical protein
MLLCKLFNSINGNIEQVESKQTLGLMSSTQTTMIGDLRSSFTRESYRAGNF